MPRGVVGPGARGRVGGGAQEGLAPPEEEVEVEAHGGEEGVDAVAVAALQEIAPMRCSVLEVSDDGLDGGTPLTKLVRHSRLRVPDPNLTATEIPNCRWFRVRATDIDSAADPPVPLRPRSLREGGQSNRRQRRRARRYPKFTRLHRAVGI
jgi:hypothetical protein